MPFIPCVALCSMSRKCRKRLRGLYSMQRGYLVFEKQETIMLRNQMGIKIFLSIIVTCFALNISLP